MEHATRLRQGSLARCLAAAFGLCAVAPAWALDALILAPDLVPREARADSDFLLEVTAAPLPRLDAQDGGLPAPRVDFALWPAAGSGLGVAVGVRGSSAPTTRLPAGYTAIRPGIDLGLTWRQAGEGRQRIDLTAWRRLASEDNAYTLVQMREPVYGARVEMKLSRTRKAGFNVERGFIGMQLESGARIAVKRKDGRPMVYYRTAF